MYFVISVVIIRLGTYSIYMKLLCYWWLTIVTLCVKLITGYGNGLGLAGNKPLSWPVRTQFIDELYVTRAQWVHVDLKSVALNGMYKPVDIPVYVHNVYDIVLEKYMYIVSMLSQMIKTM